MGTGPGAASFFLRNGSQMKCSQPQTLSLLTSDWKTPRVNSLGIVGHESLLTSRTSVNCAKNSMPNVH